MSVLQISVIRPCLVVPQIASFSSFEARKATFLLALIWIASPVAGLQPMRAARLRTCRMPRPPSRCARPFSDA